MKALAQVQGSYKKKTIKPRRSISLDGYGCSKNAAARQKQLKRLMSSGQRKRHDGWNKSIMRDGLIVILRKDGSEKVRLDPKTKEVIKGSK
jgi:hypothetical protein